MAIKVRCQRCHKKISIDEAFAGGNCRCPYCNTITMVSGKSAVSRAARPDRPDTPTSAVSQVQPVEAVPLAKPVRVQGIVTLVLSIFVLLFLVVGGFLVVKLSTGSNKPPVSNGRQGPVKNDTNEPETLPDNDDILPPIPAPTNPFTLKAPNVAGMTITGPVVYLLDGSLMTKGLYDPAVTVVRYSILSLGFREKFNVVVLNAEGFKPLGNKWLAGGEAGDAKAKQFLIDCRPDGATDLAGGIRRAMKAKSKTIVVLTCKAVSSVDELVKHAKESGVGIFTVMLDSPPDAVKVMKKLAAGTSGKCRQFASDDLVDLTSEASPLP